MPKFLDEQGLAKVAEAINAKQDVLASGVNIKTVNGQSLLGSGNIAAGELATTIFDVTTADFTSLGDEFESAKLDLSSCTIPTLVRISDSVIANLQSSYITMYLPAGPRTFIRGYQEEEANLDDASFNGATDNFMVLEIRQSFEEYGFRLALLHDLIVISSMV